MAALPPAFENLKAIVLREIISPAVWLIITVAIIYFLWGLVVFIIKGKSPEARKTGREHMLWGIVGIAIMLSVFGIMHFIFGTVTTIGGTKGIDNKTVVEPSIDRGF